jgi:maleylacetoacetate isomerase
MKLYGYWRSGAAWRVRIALNLKGVTAEQASIHLTRNGGEHRSAAYRAINPQARVPTLELDEGTRLIQSLAILEWIEETWPKPRLLPADPVARAQVRGVAALIACDIHPLTNAAGTLPYLRKVLGAGEEEVAAWIAHWTTAGFQAVEQLITPKPFCFGKEPTIADLCLVPQVAAARRFKVVLDAFPRILAVAAHCATVDAFARAAPERQPDAET